MIIKINEEEHESFSSSNDLMNVITDLTNGYKEYSHLLKHILNCKSLEFIAENSEENKIYTLINEYKNINLWYGSHTVECYSKTSFSASSWQWYWFTDSWLELVSNLNEYYSIQEGQYLPTKNVDGYPFRLGSHWKNIWKVEVFHIFWDYFIYNNKIIKASIMWC